VGPLLGNLAGQLDGFFHAGELRTLWRKLTIPATKCGCGEKLADCPFWSEIFHTAFGDVDLAAFGTQMWRLQRQTLDEFHTWLRVPALLRRTRHGLPAGGALAGYADGLGRLYRGICQVTGADVIVDSSKEPTDAVLLLCMPEIHASFVQIVRDPRGTAYSIVRLRSGDRSPAESRWRDSAYAALSWSAGNVAAAAVRRAAGPARSALIRYEDFVLVPARTVEEMAQLAGRPRRLAVSGEPGVVTIRPTHTVGGNNNRFRTGQITMREDTEWRKRLPRLERAAVTAVSLPLMAHYGYRAL
jgi:Sulfotransferase family